MTNLAHYRLTRMTLAHWREYCPRLYRQLQQAGTLLSLAQAAALQTHSQLTYLQASKVPPWEAWAEVRQQHLLLPEEQLTIPHNDLSDITQDLRSLMRQIEQD